MARGMSAPPGAWQRAAFVAVPLGLVVLIFLTPGILAPDRPQPTDIPLLTIEVIDRPWNGTVNETGLLHVRSALGTAVYDAIDIRATDANETHAASATDAPSLWLKVPVVDGWTVNVSTMAVKDTATFRYNATVEFVWGEAGWILRVQPEGTTEPRTFAVAFVTSLRREVPP
jgi:hypothetical protein